MNSLNDWSAFMSIVQVRSPQHKPERIHGCYHLNSFPLLAIRNTTLMR